MGKHRLDGILKYYEDHKTERILKLIIEIATTYRLSSWKRKGQERELEKKKIVGVLFENNEETFVDLTRHEACNKIIHAN